MKSELKNGILKLFKNFRAKEWEHEIVVHEKNKLSM